VLLYCLQCDNHLLLQLLGCIQYNRKAMYLVGGRWLKDKDGVSKVQWCRKIELKKKTIVIIVLPGPLITFLDWGCNLHRNRIKMEIWMYVISCCFACFVLFYVFVFGFVRDTLSWWPVYIFYNISFIEHFFNLYNILYLALCCMQTHYCKSYMLYLVLYNMNKSLCMSYLIEVWNVAI